MKRLVYVDTNSTGVFHKGFNSSSLLMFSLIYKKVEYYASESSAKNVLLDLNGEWPKNVVYHKIKINNPEDKKGKIIHHLLQIYYTFYLIIFSNNKQTLYFNYNPILILRQVNWLVKILKRKTIITLHSELEFLFNQNFHNLNKFSISSLKSLQKENYLWANSLYFCCLGEHIKKNSKNILSKNTWEKLLYFQHTWIFDNVDEKNKEKIDNKINIGFVGTIREEKWLESIIYLKNKLGNDRFNFNAIGRIFCSPQILQNAKINFIEGANQHFVSDHLIKKELNKQDYIVFLYPKDSFKVTFSGSIFDAINSERCILALHNDCFDSLFKKAKFGKLFNNIDQIIDFLHNNNNNMNLDFKIIKKNLLPETEVKNFQICLNKIQ